MNSLPPSRDSASHDLLRNRFYVDAFTVPSPGSIRLESGRNFLYRSPINSWDLSLAKRFLFKENVRLEIRLDAFNALNHMQFDTVNANLAVRSLTDPTATNLAYVNGVLVNKNGFGSIQAVRPPRNMQLSAHIQF